jgi:hypothetical protein
MPLIRYLEGWASASALVVASQILQRHPLNATAYHLVVQVSQFGAVKRSVR